MGKSPRLRELATRWGLDYRIGFDFNVWEGTYLSPRQALGCTAGLALMVLYVLALGFGATRWGLDYRIGFDFNVWEGTYLSPRQALGCTAGLALMVLYVLALGFGNVAHLDASAHEAFCIAFGLSVALGLNVLAYLPRRYQAPVRSTGVAVGASVAAAVGALMLLVASPMGTGASTALIAVLLPRRYQAPVRSTGVAVGASVAAAVGALMLLVASPMGTGASTALIAVLGTVTGLGSSLALLHWGFLFSRLYIPDTASCAIAGSACVALCYAALVNLAPTPWSLAIAALLPLANAMVSVGISKSWPAGIDAVDPDATTLYKTFYDRRHQWPLFTYKVALPLVCIGAVLCLLLNHTQHNLVGNGGIVGALGLFVVAVACYVAVTFGIAGLRRRTQSYARLLSMIVPLVALASLPATALPASNAAPANTSTLAATIVIVALTWTFMESMVLEYSLAPVSIFGQGLGCIALGFVAATPLLALVPDNSPWFDIAGNLVCLLMVLGMLPAHPAADLSRSVYGQGAEKEPSTEAYAASGDLSSFLVFIRGCRYADAPRHPGPRLNRPHNGMDKRHHHPKFWLI